MSQLTISLPETLYSKLSILAKHEGVSLKEYVLYALTYQVKSAYTVHAISAQEIATQKTNFADLLERLEPVSQAEADVILRQRDMIEPEKELSPEIIVRFQQNVAARKK